MKQRHLDILQQGVTVWNQWREEQREIRPDLSWVDLSNKDLSGANFSGAFLLGTKFRGSNLSRAIFTFAHLLQADLMSSNLERARFGNTNLYAALLQRANLRGARLSQANLSAANVRETDLRKADLYQTQFVRTKMEHADLSGARLGLTVFTDVDLRSVLGLEQIVHQSRSYLSPETIARSGRAMSRGFLRGVGVAEPVLQTFLESGIYSIAESSQQSQEYSPCFISYAQVDLPCAQQLYDSLQDRGIRCWLDPQDKLEDLLRFSLPHIVVISRNSVQTERENTEEPDWLFQCVIDGMGFESERERQLVFPLSLDDTIYHFNEEWVQELREAHTIYDFSQYSVSENYQQALELFLQSYKGIV